MRKELQAALQSKDVEAKFADLGVTAGDMTQQQLDAFIRSETAKWAKIVKDSGAKPE
jgi:tripartite-type tricarboxylate transporter receptor subunit TctC